MTLISFFGILEKREPLLFLFVPFLIFYPLFYRHSNFLRHNKTCPTSSWPDRPLYQVGSPVSLPFFSEKYLFSEVFVVYSGNEDRPFLIHEILKEKLS